MALGMVDETEKQSSGARLARHLSQKSLKPFIYKNKTEGHFKPLECYKGDSVGMFIMHHTSKFYSSSGFNNLR